MTQARFDVTSFGEMLLRLNVSSGDRLEAAKHLDVYPAGAGDALAALALSQFGDMVITNKEELLALGKSGGSPLER